MAFALVAATGCSVGAGVLGALLVHGFLTQLKSKCYSIPMEKVESAVNHELKRISRNCPPEVKKALNKCILKEVISSHTSIFGVGETSSNITSSFWLEKCDLLQHYYGYLGTHADTILDQDPTLSRERVIPLLVGFSALEMLEANNRRGGQVVAMSRAAERVSALII